MQIKQAFKECSLHPVVHVASDYLRDRGQEKLQPGSHRGHAASRFHDEQDESPDHDERLDALSACQTQFCAFAFPVECLGQNVNVCIQVIHISVRLCVFFPKQILY